jgi:hypothetical protein
MLDLLRGARAGGANFVPVSKIDQFLRGKKPAVFLKHDIHNVSPRKLIELAQQEADIGVFGTYFFMSFGHPRVEKFFSPDEQKIMMREIADVGHEIGAHIDALYETRQLGKSLRNAVAEQLDTFEEIVGAVSVANLHGNTAFRTTDNYGNNVVYDLFEELGRQPDYPELRHVAPDVAEYIRDNRISLHDLDLTHWGDSWIWSRDNGLIASGVLSDNWVGKEDTLQVTLNSEEPCAYGLNARPVLVPHRLQAQATWVSVGTSFPGTYQEETLPAVPLVLLLHPQFYAV